MKKFMKYPIFVLLLALFISVAVYGDTESKNIILSWTGDTSSTMTVSWQSDTADDAAKVSYYSELAGAAADPEEAAATCALVRNSGSLYQFSAELTGLEPGTSYYYTVTSNGTESARRSFMTGSDNARDTTFLFLGDMQLADTSANGDSAAQFGRWAELAKTAYQENPDIDFVQTVGDMVESGISLTQWDDLLRNASSVFSSADTADTSTFFSLPFMTAVGNHESNYTDGIPKAYLDILALPKNGPEGLEELFYSYDYGNVHVQVLNSHIYKTSEWTLTDAEYLAVKNWIADDLAATDATWRIVVTHYPVYAVASDAVSARILKEWLPIFEEEGVDLILCGHQHVYSRSYPLYQGKVVTATDENYKYAITQIMGNSGLKFYSTADEDLQVTTTYNKSNYQIVQASDQTLEVISYSYDDQDGATEIDRWATSAKTRASESAAVAFELTPEDAALTVYDSQGAEMSAKWNGSYALDAGTYSYRVKADGYATGRGRFTVSGSDVTIKVALEKSQNDVSQYTDLDTSSWYMNAVTYAVGQNLFAGNSAATFNPNASISRKEFVTVLGKMDKVDISRYTGTSFADVETGMWYSPYVEWAVQNGIVKGVGDGRFDPDGEITREQAAVIFRQYTVYATGGTTEASTSVLNSFDDRGDISDWAAYSLAWAVGNGLFNGYGNGNLGPVDAISRVQASSVFMSYLEGSILLT